MQLPGECRGARCDPARIASALLPVLAVVAAVGLAGSAAVPRAATVAAPAGGASLWRPRPVRLTRGWIMAGRHRLRPVLDVRRCPLTAELYDLAPEPGEVPVLLEPTFVTAGAAAWLSPEAPVLGLQWGGLTHCYPLALMNWHSLVRDRFAERSVLVFWDPPSGLALAREAPPGLATPELAGVGRGGTGLAYDRDSGVLWDLFEGRPLAPTASSTDVLPSPDYHWLPLQRTTWAAWRRAHADTLVLARPAGSKYNYALDPYARAAIGPGGAVESYWTSDRLLAPESLRDARKVLPDKTPVLGFLIGARPWAVSLQAADEAGAPELPLSAPEAAGYVLHVAPEEDRYEVLGPEGQRPPQARLFWFAWQARFPQTQVWTPAAPTTETSP